MHVTEWKKPLRTGYLVRSSHCTTTFWERQDYGAVRSRGLLRFISIPYEVLSRITGAMVLNGVILCLPGDICQYREKCCVVITGGKRWYCNLVGRSQRNCWLSHNAEDQPAQKRQIWSEMSVVLPGLELIVSATFALQGSVWVIKASRWWAPRLGPHSGSCGMEFLTETLLGMDNFNWDQWNKTH